MRTVRLSVKCEVSRAKRAIESLCRVRRSKKDPPARYSPKNPEGPRILAAPGAMKYSPKQFMKICDPVDWEKQAVRRVHLYSPSHQRLHLAEGIGLEVMLFYGSGGRAVMR